MLYEGYANPVMNDGPSFHSDMPVSELIERVTRATKACDVSSAPPVVETTDGVTHETQPTPTEPNRAQGLKTLRLARSLGSPGAWIHDSDSPGPSARPTPRSGTPTRPIP